MFKKKKRILKVLTRCFSLPSSSLQTLVNCTVHNNSAHYGGVFYYSPRRSSNEISSGSDYNIALDGVTIRNNTAKIAGGVLFSSFSKVPYSVVGSDIRDNFAVSIRGALYFVTIYIIRFDFIKPSGSLVATRMYCFLFLQSIHFRPVPLLYLFYCFYSY